MEGLNEKKGAVYYSLGWFVLLVITAFSFHRGYNFLWPYDYLITIFLVALLMLYSYFILITHRVAEDIRDVVFALTLLFTVAVVIGPVMILVW
jgi:hypothetical protein